MKRKYFFIWVFILFIMVTLDILTTMYENDDFKYERNPIPLKYGLSMFQFYIYLLLYQVPYVVCFYFHVFHFSIYWKKSVNPSVFENIKKYFFSFQSNKSILLSFFSAFVNFWGFYFIRVNTIYRFVVVLHNYAQIYFTEYISNLSWYDFTVLKKPIPVGDNKLEEFIIWYYFTGVQGNDNIKLIIEILLGFFIVYFFCREYFFYHFNDNLFEESK